jgi:hypothetical protein
MTKQDLEKEFTPFIIEDQLEEAVQWLINKLAEIPQGQSASRLSYVKQQAEHIAGQLNRLNEDVRMGIIDFDDMSRKRNEIRKSLQNLPKVLLDANHKDPDYEKADLIRTGKKWGMIVLKAYLIWTAIVLVLVGLIGKFIYNQFQEDFNPKASVSVVTNICFVEALAELPTYKQPKLNASRVGKVPKGASLQVEKIGSINSQFGRPSATFLAVSINGKKRWIKSDGLVKVDSKCIYGAEPHIDSEPIPTPPASSPITTSTPTPTPTQSCRNSSTCCLITGHSTALHQEPDPFSQRLINSLPTGRKLEVLERATYNHGGLSTMTFYKVQTGGYTGWILHQDSQYVNPLCVQ